jgi:hypothetical protein
MIRGTLALLIVLIACSEGRSANTRGEDPAAGKLVGVWDATLKVGRPYPLQLQPSQVTTICGTIGLIENGTRSASAEDVASATQLGVYDLPLSQIGLEWNGKAAFPAVTASIAGSATYASPASGSDSVRIVLNPGSEERIILSGRYEPGGIQGTWTAQSARGTANGSFSMRPHGRSQIQSERC